MGLSAVLKMIKKTYVHRKIVDFEEGALKLRLEMEPLTAFDEMKIMESVKDIDGALYIDSLKRHSLACSIRKIVYYNDDKEVVIDLIDDLIDYQDDKGVTKSKSRFLYMVDFLGECPTSMIDILFEAHTNIQQEAEALIKKSAKYEITKITEEPRKDKEPEFKQDVAGDDVPKEELSETERLKLRVEKELDAADQAIARQG